tara:strand:- start:584 stop:973 length:390 start_codon:yes stop_codon:yes gene_type:complete
MNTINFNEAFIAAEATTPFDQLITVLNMAQKAVKTERDRLSKDDTAEVKFTEAVMKVSALSTQLADDPSLIDDYLAAATEMKRANTSRNQRGEKSIPQWAAINECWDYAQDLMSGLSQDETEAELALAA